MNDGASKAKDPALPKGQAGHNVCLLADDSGQQTYQAGQKVA